MLREGHLSYITEGGAGDGEGGTHGEACRDGQAVNGAVADLRM
jgi:hypothetical protein